MRKWGNYKTLNLAYPRPISKTTKVNCDSCIVNVLQYLNDKKIHTLGCCCGHGKANPDIIISDDYTNNDVQKILDMIKSIDDRDWQIEQWQLRLVGKSSEGLINKDMNYVDREDQL